MTTAVKKIIKNAIGLAIGQGAVLVSLPLLTQIYSKEDFGNYGFALLIASNAMICGLLRMDLAISKSHGSLNEKLESASLWIPLVLGFLALIILVALNWALNVEIPYAFILIGIFAAYFQLAISALNGRRSDNKILVIRVSQAVVFVVASIAKLGLVNSLLLSYVISVIYANRYLKIKPLKFKSSVNEIKKNIVYIKVSLPGAVMDSLGYSISYVVVFFIYGPVAGAIYSQTQRIASAPLSLIGPAISQYLLSIGTYSARNSWTILVFKNMLRIGCTAAVLHLLIIYTCGEGLINLLLGREWFISIEFILFLGIAAVVRSVISPASTLLALENKHQPALLAQIVIFSVSIGLYPVSAINISFESYAKVYAAVELLIYTIYGIIIYKSLVR